MGRLQNNPSIRWVHPKSTHAHPLTWGDKKTGARFSVTGQRGQETFSSRSLLCFGDLQEPNLVTGQRGQETFSSRSLLCFGDL